MELPLQSLRDIQGIIVTGYGHQNHRALLLLQIHEAAGARGWLEELIPLVATAAPYGRLPSGEKDKPKTALAVAFTHPGLKAIGLTEQSLVTFEREFILGMPARHRVLGDRGTSAPEHWQVGGPQNPQIHVLVTISGVTSEEMNREVETQYELIEKSRGAVEVVQAEGGSRPLDQKEPFGFRDGISNPVIEGTPGRQAGGPNNVVKTGEFILGYLNELKVFPGSPAIPAELDPKGILPRFPEGAAPECRDFGRNGSYLAYRKLEQDVAGFWRFAREQARRPDGTVDEQRAVWTAAKFFGRWPGGAPLVLSPDGPCAALDMATDFSYQPTDRHGFKCPIGAHTRRANPRDSLFGNSPADSYSTTRQHRIMRRAVSYGEDYLVEPNLLAARRLPATIEDDGEERGIHFMAVNASLANQFEMVTQSWVNLPQFNGLYDNRDPVVGDNTGTGNMTIERDPLRLQITGVPRFVHVRGGAYFILPSITSLRYLAEGL
jgi:Dyp-type peroxidase family